MKKLFYVVALLLPMTTISHASEKLPADAKPLVEAEMQKIYSGNSVSWSPGFGYFNPNGTFVAYWKDSAATGTWSIHGNEICYSAVWKDENGSKPETLCWKDYLAGKKPWVEDSKNADDQGRISSGRKKIVKGDKATKAANKILAKL